MKKKQYDDDDGRQIANMSDVHITPFGFGYMNRRKRLATSKHAAKAKSQPEYVQEVTLTKKETRFMMLRAMLAALGIAMVFIIGAALFILFCIYVWFR